MSNVRIIRPAIMNGTCEEFLNGDREGTYVAIIEHANGVNFVSGTPEDNPLAAALSELLKWDGNANVVPTSEQQEKLQIILDRSCKLGYKMKVDYFDVHFGLPTDKSGYGI